MYKLYIHCRVLHLCLYSTVRVMPKCFCMFLWAVKKLYPCMRAAISGSKMVAITPRERPRGCKPANWSEPIKVAHSLGHAGRESHNSCCAIPSSGKISQLNVHGLKKQGFFKSVLACKFKVIILLIRLALTLTCCACRRLSKHVFYVLCSLS
jgi:hypothetical protein